MSNNIQQKAQMARELAYGELKKLPQYKFAPIPQSVLDAKMNEYIKLSEKELQEKITEFYSANAFGTVGDMLEISEEQQKNNYEQYRIMMSPKTEKTEQAKQVAQLNKQMRKLGIESNTPISTLSQSEEEALGFMEEMLQDATQTFETQLKNDNWITKGYNALVKETFDSEYSKSNVQKALDETQNDITSLKTTVDFKETFKQTRGVEFNEGKIKETKEKAEAMVKYQASSDMVKNLKQKLSSALTNTSGNNISRSGEKAIIETLSSMGYTSIGEVIQSAIKGHENDAAIKNYMKEGGNFAVRKDKDGNVGIYRETKEGGYQPITQEMAQIIGEEIDLRLNKLYAQTLGIPESELEGKSSAELEELTSNKFNELKLDYEQTFAEAYGKKDIKALSENYMLSQQEGQAYIQMGVNFLAMAGAMFSGGGTLGLVSMGTIMTNPVDLIARATDEEGMTKQDWQEYGDSVLEQAGWMALGMGAGKVGDMTRSFVKLKGLQKAFKESGKSFDEFMKLAQMNKDIPQDIAKALRKTKIMSEGLGVSAEVATDLATTYALQKDGATTTDWVMSITSTLAGTATFKQLASKLRGLKSNPSATIQEIKQTFSALDLTDADAMKLHKAIEGVVANEAVPTIKQDNSLQTRLENAKSREDFAAIRDELKNMPAGAEKTALMEAYQKKYREEYSTSPDRPDVRMEYKPVEHKTEYQISKENENEINNALEEMLDNDPEFQKTLANRIERFSKSKSNSDPISEEDMLRLRNRTIRSYIEDMDTTDSINLSDEIKSKMKNYIKENDLYNIYDDVNSMNDIEVIQSFYERLIKNQDNRNKVEDDFIYSLKTGMKNNNLPEETVNIIINKFKNNELNTLTSQELRIVTSLLDKASNKEDFVELAKFDYSLLNKRKILNILPKNASAEQIKELLYCSDEEFLIKKQRLENRSADLPDKNSNYYNQQFKNIINMSDEDYISYKNTKSEFVDILKKETVIDSNGSSTSRFTDNDIEKLVNLLSIENPDNTKFIKDLINEQTIDSNGNTVARFKVYDIEKFVNLSKENPNNTKFIKEFINEKSIDSNGNTVARFDTYDIETLVNLSNENPNNIQFINDLIKEKTINSNGNTVARFSSSDIEKFVNLSKENPDNVQIIKDLINKKTIDSNGYNIPKFNVADIEKLINLSKENPENTQFIKDLINKTIDYKGNTVARFDSSDIEKLINLSKENPDNTQFIKDLINGTINYNGNTIPRFTASDIEKLVELSSNKNNKNLINNLLNMKTQNDKPLLNRYNIEKIIEVNKTNTELINKLISNKKYNIFLQGINENNIHFFEDETLLNTISKQIKSDNNYFYLHNNYLDNSYQFEFSNGKDKQVFFITKTDKGLEYNGSETQKRRGNKTLVRREFNDGSYLVEEIGNINVIINEVSASIPLSMKKTQFDNNGVQVRSEVLTPSKDKPGTYTINVYERGLNKSMLKKPIGTVELYGSKNQGMKAKRTVTASDGTVTTHTIIQGPKGSGMKYVIKDKDGNILGTVERQYRKIDDNHYTSSVNGQKYDTQFVDERVIVSKVDKNGNKIETIKLGSDILDPQLIDLYKKLPGDYFFKIKEIGLKKIYLDSKIHYDAEYRINANLIAESEELKNNPFVFIHELGHAIDYNYNLDKIQDNPELNNIYKEELAEYKKVSSDAEGHSIDYFTTKTGGSRNPIEEVIAEFNALTSGLINDDFDNIQLRSVVLQQHFPKTCAKIMELMNN